MSSSHVTPAQISADTNTTWYLKATSDEEVQIWTSKILLNISSGEESCK